MVRMTTAPPTNFLNRSSVAKCVIERCPKCVGNKPESVEKIALSRPIRANHKCQSPQINTTRCNAFVIAEGDSRNEWHTWIVRSWDSAMNHAFAQTSTPFSMNWHWLLQQPWPSAFCFAKSFPPPSRRPASPAHLRTSSAEFWRGVGHGWSSCPQARQRESRRPARDAGIPRREASLASCGHGISRCRKSPAWMPATTA